MKPVKKILSAMLAAVLLTASVSGGSTPLTVYAAEETEEWTYDNEHLLTDPVDPYSFEIDFDPDFYSDNDEFTDILEALEKRLLSAVGKSNISNVTYRDLQRVSSLNLSGMKLTGVPSCVNYMTNLRTLNLSNNLLRYEALSNITLIACTKLTNIDLSRNYLDRVPGWFVNQRVTTKNIRQNFIEGEEPRSIKVTETTYYLMNGDVVDVDELKNRILRSVRLNDDTLLPSFLFNYVDDAYHGGALAVSSNQLDFVDWDQQLKSFFEDIANSAKKRVKVAAGNDKTVDVTIRLFKNSTGDNTKTTVRFYLMDGTGISSVKQNLRKLLDDCGELSSKKADYTESTWERFDAALQTAQAIYDFSGSDAAMLASAMTQLSNAKNALTLSAATIKKTIDDLVKIGGLSPYKEENYTPESWAGFVSALNRLKELQNDKNASISAAQSAIKAFQSAQSKLVAASLDVPEKVTKAAFEAFYGENINRSYSGTTRDGAKYTWTFNGRDIVNLVEFNPEVKNTDAVEESILLEAGSASKYRLFSTVHTAAFPGKALLEIDVADYEDGSYYLYKWNNTEKRSKMIGTTTVNNGRASVMLEEGGVYYISKNIRNFDLTVTGTQFKLDNSTKTVVIPLLASRTVNQLRSSMDFGNYVEVRDQNGDTVSNVSTLYPGMTVNAPGGDKYTFKASGDLNNDNAYNIKDVAAIMEIVVNNGDTTYADINGDGVVNIADASRLLEYVVYGR